ncbi:MAG: hypothetical protein JWM41_1812 [Gemmatimonadetes bacterium]|nr:hypothetical protein [Gemmatimonadota bacterium]
MYALLREYLARQRIGTALVAPADVVFSPARAVQPDVFVVPLNDGRRAECFADVGRLLVAIEVLSATSARADRVAKRMMYRDVGVGEYWIVDLDARTVERSTPHEARPEILVEQLGWSPEGADDPFRVDLTAYFAAILDS